MASPLAIPTATEVKNVVNYPLTGAPVSDSSINEFILDSVDETNQLLKTKVGFVDDSGTATGSHSTTTLQDTSQTWTADEWCGFVLWIYSGTGSGQYREVVSNTTDTLTLSPALDTAPDNTSLYRITRLGYKDETVDGSGIETQFLNYQPLISLNSVTIDGTSVTTSEIYQYNNSGKLELKTSAEESRFQDNEKQLVNFKYVYGLYPVPRIVKRVVSLIAGLKVLDAAISGTFDDFTSMSLPGGVQGNKGEPYVNLRAGAIQIQKELDDILERKFRPFVLFG